MTALAAHGVAAGGGTAAVGGVPVEPPVDLAAARRRRASRIWKPVLAVAGAAAIGVGVISGVANLAADGGGDDSASEAAVTLAASDAPDSALDADGSDRPPARRPPNPRRERIRRRAVATRRERRSRRSASPTCRTRPSCRRSRTPSRRPTGPSGDRGGRGGRGRPGRPQRRRSRPPSAAPALTTEQQLAAFSAGTETRSAAAPAPAESSSSSPCPDLGYPAGSVVWQGTPGDLYVSVPTDEDSPAVATVATVDCVILVSVQIRVP